MFEDLGFLWSSCRSTILVIQSGIHQPVMGWFTREKHIVFNTSLSNYLILEKSPANTTSSFISSPSSSSSKKLSKSRISSKLQDRPPLNIVGQFSSWDFWLHYSELVSVFSTPPNILEFSSQVLPLPLRTIFHDGLDRIGK